MVSKKHGRYDSYLEQARNLPPIKTGVVHPVQKKPCLPLLKPRKKNFWSRF